MPSPIHTAERDARAALARLRSTAHATTLRLASLLLGALALAACGSPPPPTQPTDARPVTATITPDGGVMQAADDAGVTVRLAFPAGAVREALTLTLSPADPAGAHARFALEPYGLRLHAPVEIRVTLPSGMPASGVDLHFEASDHRVPIVTTSDAGGRTLQASTRFLGYDFARPLPSSTLGGDLVVAGAECTTALQDLTSARIRAASAGVKLVADADAIRSAYLASRKHCPEFDTADAYAEERAFLQRDACEGYANARVDALTLYTPALNPAVLDRLWVHAESLIAWAASIALSAAECVPPLDLDDVLEELFQRYLDVAATRLADLDPERWREIWAVELPAIADLMDKADIVALPNARQRAEEALAQPLFDTLRAEAYERCVEDRTQAFLADIRNGGGHVAARLPFGFVPDTWTTFSRQAITRDIHHCGNRVSVQVFDDVPSLVPSETRLLGGGSLPGDHTTDATVRVPTGGALTLSGVLRALRCERTDGLPRFSDDAVVMAFDGVEVARRHHSAGEYLASAVDLPLGDLLAAVGLPPDATGTFELTLQRQGEICDGAYGDTDTALYELRVVVGEPTVTLTCRASGTGLTTLAFAVHGADERTILATATPDGATQQTCQQPGFDPDDVALVPHTATFTVTGPDDPSGFDGAELSLEGRVEHASSVALAADGSGLERFDVSATASAEASYAMEARSPASAATDVFSLAHGHGRADASPTSWNVLRFVVGGGPVDVTLSGSMTFSAVADGDSEPGVAFTRTSVSLVRLVEEEREVIVDFVLFGELDAEGVEAGPFAATQRLEPGEYLLMSQANAVVSAQCNPMIGNPCARSGSAATTLSLTLVTAGASPPLAPSAW